MRLTAALSLVGLSASTQRWMPAIMEPTSMEVVISLEPVAECAVEA
jgi:hypothetical protein